MINFKRAEIVKSQAILGVILLDAKIPYSHLVYKESYIILNGVLHFKSHTWIVYKIKH